MGFQTTQKAKKKKNKMTTTLRMKRQKKQIQKQKKSPKKRKKNQQKARTTAEKVLCFDPMLWTNGTQKVQNSFASRYRQLMEKIGSVFEAAIFDSDDYVILCILKWCKFFAKQFKVTQFRRLGTLTAFALCHPFIHCMAKNRKPMEKLRDKLEREKISQKQKQEKKRKSP